MNLGALVLVTVLRDLAIAVQHEREEAHANVRKHVPLLIACYKFTYGPVYLRETSTTVASSWRESLVMSDRCHPTTPK